MLDHRVPGRQAQRIGGDFQLVLAVVAAGGSDDGFQLALLGGECVKVGVFFGVSRVHLFQALFGVNHFFHAAFDRFAHGLFGA